MAEYESTLCWECKNTNRRKCSWFNPADPQPVPGWVAELRPKAMIGESYMVKECPNFDPEPKRETPPPPSGVCIPGVHRKKTKAGYCWEARIMHGPKNYHLGTFTSLEKATAVRLAAEEAIARGEEPQRKEPQPGESKRKEPHPKEPLVKKKTARRACPGVYCRRGFWEARASYQGLVYHLGCFKTEKEAVAARKAAEKSIKRGMPPRASNGR